MSSVRRKRSDSNSPSKRLKTSTNTLYWEWEGDKSTWTAFSDDHNQEINDANENGENSVKMSIAGCEIEVKLDRLVQRNCKTGWERRIRASVEDSGSFFAWQWQDEKNRWNTYTPQVTRDLEQALESGQGTVKVEASNRTYTVDVKSMEQTNDSTSVIRKVQRIKSVHKAPPAAAASQPAKRRGRSGASQASSSAAVSDASDSEAPAEMAASGDTKTKIKKESSQNKKSKPSTSKSSGAPAVKTVRITGNSAPVDSECTQMVNKAQVYKEGSTIYDAMLNQTNLKNNNNKYYICQLLQEMGKSRYSVWFRWGRVGMKGQNTLTACGPDLEEAKSIFEKKFLDKTKNQWSERNDFEKVPGKYDMLEMDYSTKGKDEPDASSKVKKEPDSKLDKRLQEIIKMICNVRAMEEMVVEMKYDAQKAPLGKLTAEQIKAGYLALKKIETCINKKIVGDKLIKACDEFYTRIPHNFGMHRPPVIRTTQDLRAKIALLEALSDIQIAMTVLKQEQDVNENPVDNQYHALKCDLNPLSKTHPDVKMVKDYMKNTHAKTHMQYTMEVQEVFTLDRHGEAPQFKDVGNRLLLWHGSRMTNMAGIMGQGLRIAPPEAPVTGYMFGKGVYFADMSSKSANYCFASRNKPVGFLLLCEVAVGDTNDLLAADYDAATLPSGTHSVKGLGKMAPDSSVDFKMSDGTKVPLGKTSNTGVNNPNGYTLNYNEYVVYNVNQIKMRYLVQTKFNFK